MTKKKKVSSPQALQNVEETLTRTEQYLEDNYKTLLTWLAVIIGIVGLIWLGRILLNKRSLEASTQMFQAERYFEQDSMLLALNGDGNYPGFIDIASTYKNTRAGNLARYYAGIAFLKSGEFENAIEYLGKFRNRDKVLAATATAATGDAWVELGDLSEGVTFYMKAAGISDGNSFLEPVFLMKAAQVYESLQEYAKAAETYERIFSDYPTTSEGQTAEKLLARVRLLAK
ncbi:MAG: tetratricopeptide repeat protein [Bacteroidetes bacterium]|nr:tetratricopeptide repeat protein [Bacteroidota bacterium]